MRNHGKVVISSRSVPVCSDKHREQPLKPIEYIGCSVILVTGLLFILGFIVGSLLQ